MSTQPTSFLTPEQYLEIERKAEFKSEYYNGEMFAMAGGREPHNLIMMNIGIALGRQLQSRGCRVYGSDMRVHVPATGLYTYPDVAALCGPPELQDAVRDTLLNPVLIVEVLSPSTEAYDRGRKFEHYRSIDSLRHYVLVSSDRVHIDLYTFRDGRWTLSSAGELEAKLELDDIGCHLALADVYVNVEF